MVGRRVGDRDETRPEPAVLLRLGFVEVDEAVFQLDSLVSSVRTRRPIKEVFRGSKAVWFWVDVQNPGVQKSIRAVRLAFCLRLEVSGEYFLPWLDRFARGVGPQSMRPCQRLIGATEVALLLWRSY